MRKKFKTLCKFLTALITIGGILYIARDQIKAIFDKIKELTGKKETEDDDFDDDIFDDDDIFGEDDIFPESSKDDRDYVSIHINGDDADDIVPEDDFSADAETEEE